MVEWITISSNSGNSGTTVITVSAATYSELMERTTLLTVNTVNSSLSERVTILQEPREVVSVMVSPTTISAPSTGGTYMFNIISNGEWTIEYPEWMTLSQSAGTGNTTITVNLEENFTIDELIGNIVVSTIDNSATVQVSQARIITYINVSPSTLNYFISGGTSTITVESNAPWTVSTNVDWLSFSSSAGTGNGSITVTCNVTSSERNAVISFVTLDETENVSVIQKAEPEPLRLSVSPTSINVPFIGSAYTLTVNSNTEWEIVSYPNWVTTSILSGNGDTEVVVTVDDNVDIERNDNIIFRTISSALTAVVSLTQEEAPVGSTEYLTFNIISDGLLNWRRTSNTAPFITIEYKKNNGDWTSIQSNDNTPGHFIEVEAGDTVLLRGSNNSYGGASFDKSTASFTVSGNILSLIDKTNFSRLYTLKNANAFSYLFCCTGLTDASNLELQAIKLSNSCYYYMFRGCTSLTTAPELPATTLESQCYYGMFSNCSNLTTAPSVLPATTLADYCYYNMFHNCTSLTTTPELSASTLAINCCLSMFEGCTGLTSAPELSASTLASGCYRSMFAGCTSLTTAPSVLPATTLAQYCYYQMFRGCTSLTTTPELPATTLADYCYSSMFYGCTSLTTAPELSASTLANHCYENMFHNCTSLTTAPELPATILAYLCYSNMFQGCSNLNYIKCLATDISEGGCTYNWVDGVASTGTFVKNASMTSWTTGTNGIPSGWTIQDAS